jgi:hypothetical protein
MYEFTMPGHVTVDGNTAASAEPGVKDLVQTEGQRTSAVAGWWIVPSVAMGAAFWALIISWAFGFG